MIALLKVELTRLRVRRAAVVLLIAAIVVPVVIALFVVAASSAPDSAQLEKAQKRADRQVVLCEKRPQRYGIRGDNIHEQCVDQNRAEYFYNDYNTLSLDREREDGSGKGVAAVVGVLMFLLGTTFVGHDWATGSMSNQLLFEPRRLRIWGAKAAAVTLAAVAVSLVGATLFWLLLRAKYTSGDVSLGDGVFLDCLQQGWRGAGLAGAAALGGYALTMLSRSTVVTLGVLFGISVAGGIIIANLVDDPGWLDPTINANAVIGDGADYYIQIDESCYENEFFDGSGSGGEQDDACNGVRHRSLNQGLVYYAIALGALGAASAGSFRRRDVP